MKEERERKYLVKSDVWHQKVSRGNHYRQGYLSTDPERSVRIRAGGKQAFLTIKGKSKAGSTGLSRLEFEYAIPLDEANQLLDLLSEKPLIQKTRYRIQENGQAWEIDKFEKENRGLVLAEAETDSEAPPVLPEWVGEEVSKDPRYENVNLVKHPFVEWHGGSGKPETKYAFKGRESVAEGIRRIIQEQLGLAIWHLSQNGGQLDDAVHEARKSIKRVRSILRLVRTVIGEKYNRENDVLRELGGRLSRLRDAEAVIETLDELKQESNDDPSIRSLDPVRSVLVTRKKETRESFKKYGEAGEVAKTLQEVCARVGDWPLENADVGIVSRAIASALRRGRKSKKQADESGLAEDYHEWRKRAKDLRYHLELVEKTWEPVFGGYLNSATDLEQRLGDDHNLAVLHDVLLDSRNQFGPRRVKTLLRILGDRQKRLRTEANSLAERLYGEKPRWWQQRVERCWDARREEKDRDSV